MIIEARTCLNLPVINEDGQSYGQVDFLVFSGRDNRVVGAQIVRGSVIKKFFGLHWEDTTGLNRQAIGIKDQEALKNDLKDLDEVFRRYGRVLDVAAVTESGKTIGKISDVLLEVESGRIVRLVVGHLFNERIIPVKFLVAITPKQVVFKDVVNEPVFDEMASAPLEVKPEAAE